MFDCRVFPVVGQAVVLANCLSIDLASLIVARPQWGGADAPFFERRSAAFKRAQAASASYGILVMAY